MLDTPTKRRIDNCRDILVGKLPDPKSQIEQITIALIYKFMNDMDRQNQDLGGEAKFFTGEFEKYSWDNLFDSKVTSLEMLNLYMEAIEKMELNPNIPELFRSMFKNAYLPYRDPETLRLFLKTIGKFEYTHSEKLGDAFEYLLSVMGSQGDAGQFRTPRHIIDFIVEVVDPGKKDRILDPACGTSGFLISAYNHIRKKNNNEFSPDEKKRLIENSVGYDISPDMVRLSLVNLYLHQFSDPHIYEYDTLSSEERWNDNFDVILANPPFMSPKGGIKPHKRFSIQSSRAEVLFVDYILDHLSPKGKAGVIVPEGIIFQSNNAYTSLRKKLVNDALWAVVSLPSGVFNPYSGVKTSILLIDKELAKKSDSILFVKIENEGFKLGAQRNEQKGTQLPLAIEILAKFREAKEFKTSSFAHPVKKTKINSHDKFTLVGNRYLDHQQIGKTDYEIVEIGEVFETSSGGTPSRKNEDYYDGGTIPWLRSGEVSQGLITSSELMITELGLSESSAKIFPVDTVLVAMYGATAGQVGLLKFESSTNQAICGILPNRKKALPAFVYLMLRSQKDYMVRLSGGGAQPNISQKIIKKLKIPLPPLKIQEEIVEELEGYQSIVNGAQMVVENYRPKFKIDSDYKVVELEEIASFRYGYTDSAKDKGDYRFIRITDIGDDGLIRNEDPKYISNSPEARKYLLKKGDLLVARTGATYGKTLMFNDDYPAVYASYLINISFNKDEVLNKYYWIFTLSNNYDKQKKSLATGGGQPQFNANALKRIKLPLPNIDIQKKIINEVEIELEIVESNRKLIKLFEQKIKNKISEVWGEKRSEDE